MDSNPVRELHRLIEQRDLRAYDVVGAVAAVLTFWEAQTFDEAESRLRFSLDQFHLADQRVTEFYEKYSFENPPKKGNSYAVQASNKRSGIRQSQHVRTEGNR